MRDLWCRLMHRSFWQTTKANAYVMKPIWVGRVGHFGEREAVITGVYWQREARGEDERTTHEVCLVVDVWATESYQAGPSVPIERYVLIWNYLGRESAPGRVMRELGYFVPVPE